MSVDEDQGVQPDAQAMGDGAQVGCFVLPVGHETGDIPALQQHVRMAFERLDCVGHIVLGADREDDAARLPAGVVL